MDAPDSVCFRCSKPITSGTVSQLYGRPVHMRCLGRETRLESVERQDRSGLERLRASAARVRAEELMEAVRVSQATCPACGERLGTSGGVLFQGDQLVHAACWRADPRPFDTAPPA
jgi:hypothetical protein